jgi:hypothetical protein
LRGAPIVIGSIESSMLSRVSVTSWIENIDSTKFQACFRGVNGHLPAHTMFTWVAFEKQSRVWPTAGTEVSGSHQNSGRVTAPSWRLRQTSARGSKLFVACKTVAFAQSFNTVPTVLVTANHQVDQYNCGPLQINIPNLATLFYCYLYVALLCSQPSGFRQLGLDGCISLRCDYFHQPGLP